MKLKYKKMVIGITMGTMCIGFVTFSLLSPSVGTSANIDKKSNVEQEASANDAIVVSNEPSAAPTTEASNGVMELKEDAYPEVNTLVTNYFKASTDCDLKTMESLVTNISFVDEDSLRNKDAIIEGYENIQCYTIDGPVEGTYRVYACVDVKILDINTPAPGVYGLYVTTTPEGVLKVCNDEVDAQVQEFFQEADNSEAVKKLNETINTKLEELKTTDADLKAFCDKLNNASNAAQATVSPSANTEESTTEAE